MAFLNKYLLPVIICILLQLMGPESFAADKRNIELGEQEIKAAMLYNFLKYTQWPTENIKGDPANILLCVFGNDPLNGFLKPMEGRTVNQRTIKIRYFHAVKKADGCNLLFFNAEERSSWPKLHDYLKDKAVLTVSDYEGFLQSGGIIEFNLKDSHINAELNMHELHEANIQIDEKLLKLVTAVDSYSSSNGGGNK